MYFDIIGAFFSLLSTYYFINLNTRAWIVGIFATCLNGWLYWHKGIYADMSLELIYFFNMGYGWYQWKNCINNEEENSLLNYFNVFQWLALLSFSIPLFLIIHYLLKTYTDSSVAVIDALTTTLSLVAQWLMCKKIIITWVLWFITDLIYAWMYFQKQLPFHCILMMIYTALAITGYWSWTKMDNKREQIRESNWGVS